MRVDTQKFVVSCPVLFQLFSWASDAFIHIARKVFFPKNIWRVNFCDTLVKREVSEGDYDDSVMQVESVPILRAVAGELLWNLQWSLDVIFHLLCLRQRSSRTHNVSRVFVHLCTHSCVSPEQTLLARYLGYLSTVFDQTFTTNRLWGKGNCIKFWVKSSSIKVTMGLNMPRNALFDLVVVTCWWRHNSWWSRNHHLVFLLMLFSLIRIFTVLQLLYSEYYSKLR